MANILEGLQFREPHAKFPHWNPKDPYVLNDTYGNWKDIPGGLVSFSSGCKFRPKPTKHYTLTLHNELTVSVPNHYASKDAVMADAARALDRGEAVQIERFEKTPEISFKTRKIQYRLNAKGDWINLENLSSEWTFNGAVTFRIRPDHYHVVDSVDPINKGSIAFHDIDGLAKYVDNRIRTNGLDFSVKKVKYV